MIRLDLSLQETLSPVGEFVGKMLLIAVTRWSSGPCCNSLLFQCNENTSPSLCYLVLLWIIEGRRQLITMIHLSLFVEKEKEEGGDSVKWARKKGCWGTRGASQKRKKKRRSYDQVSRETNFRKEADLLWERERVQQTNRGNMRCRNN